jgi:hypothetical protein
MVTDIPSPSKRFTSRQNPVYGFGIPNQDTILHGRFMQIRLCDSEIVTGMPNPGDDVETPLFGWLRISIWALWVSATGNEQIFICTAQNQGVEVD